MRPGRAAAHLAAAAMAGLVGCRADVDGPVVVASKSFTESVVLGEAARAVLGEAGVPAVHRRALGGTRLVFDALVAGDVDVYAEYTGTLRHEVLRGEPVDDPAGLEAALAARGLRATAPLGFTNDYALAVRREVAARRGLARISDLGRHPDLVLRFSSEFVDRADGWRGLRARYALPHRDVRGLEHDLAYRGVATGAVDVIDVYTTDAEIAAYDLVLLEDDLGHFPAYEAVLLYRAALARERPGAVRALERLAGAIDVASMRAMNAAVEREGASEGAAVRGALGARLGLGEAEVGPGRLARVLARTREHLALVSLSLAAAVVVAVPLGVAAARLPRLGQAILGAVGVAQTVPALALLVFMVPLFGIGAGPALVALFLYALLPIVRNTHAGLVGIPRPLRESAEALGLTAWARLRHVEGPLALPSILAGVKTAAVIDVGAATLGALVGAGGYGQPILTGIRLDDVGLLLEGAVPAALLALAMQGAFELAERRLVPRGLRRPRGRRGAPISPRPPPAR